MPLVTQLETPPGLAAKDSREGNVWWQVFWLGLLTLWLYSPVLARLCRQWWRDPNFSHGFFVPIFSLFVIVHERARLHSLSRKPSAGGLLVMAMALGLLIVGTLGAELFLARISFVLLLLGLIALLGGWNYCRGLLFPWAFLFLMIPIPTILFDQVTFPMQIFASKVAAGMLPLFGVPVLREGNVINLPAMTLQVAEACSGIRSLLSLVALAIIYGYFAEKSLSGRILLALAAVPIAIVANSLRIVGTGLLVQYWSPDKAEGFFHLFSGWLIFLASLGMLFLLRQFLNRVHRPIEIRHVS